MSQAEAPSRRPPLEGVESLLGSAHLGRQVVVDHRRDGWFDRRDRHAALETRATKQPVDLAALRADWQDRAGKAGMGARRWQELLTTGRKQRRRTVTRTVNTLPVPPEVLVG